MLEVGGRAVSSLMLFKRIAKKKMIKLLCVKFVITTLFHYLNCFLSFFIIIAYLANKTKQNERGLSIRYIRV